MSGFAVGQKIALGYGATYPPVARDVERYEVATVTAVGKQGTQAYLEGGRTRRLTNLKVTSVADISVGDKIRLDIDSVGHGIETITVAHVGTRAYRTNLSAEASAGATKIKVRSVTGFVVGKKITVGTPATQETVTITAVGTSGFWPDRGLDVKPPSPAGISRRRPWSIRARAWSWPHRSSLVTPPTCPSAIAERGSALHRRRPLRTRATSPSRRSAQELRLTSLLPMSTRSMRWFVTPPSLRRAIREARTERVVRRPRTLDQHCQLGRATISLSAGNIVLREHRLVVDSLNYGLLVDPWAAKGYQAASGPTETGCRVIAPGLSGGIGPALSPMARWIRAPAAFRTASTATATVAILRSPPPRSRPGLLPGRPISRWPA